MSGNAKPIAPRQQAGFSFVLPLIVVMAVATMAFSFMPRETQRLSAERDIQVATTQMQQLAVAVKAYVVGNAAALESTATPTAPSEIAIQDLIDAGLLPSGWQAVNPWGQSYRIFAFLDNGGTEDALKVLTIAEGGQPGGAPFGTLEGAAQRMVNQVIPSAAASIGASGGFMPSSTYPGADGTTLFGANGIWTFDTAGKLPFQPAQGALANLQYFTAGTLDNDYLYRVAVPGRPELNTMHTSLDMDGNDITNVESLTDMTGHISTTGEHLSADGNVFEAEQGNITLDDGTVYSGDMVISDMKVGGGSVPLSRGVYDMRKVSSGGSLPRPTCPAGTAAQVFASVDAMPLSASNGIQTTSGMRAGNLLAYRTRAVASGSAWTIYVDANIDGGWYVLAPTEATAIVAPKCT